MFQNISNFSNTSDYLPILNGALMADLIYLFLLIFGFIQSKKLKEWYRKYTLSAAIEDTIVLVLGLIIVRLLYKPIFGATFSLLKFTLLAIGIQIIHDVLFYFFFQQFPRGKNRMMDTFQDYAKEAGLFAIFGDSCMIAITCILSSYFASLSTNSNIVLLFFIIYFIPYTLYTF
jgi:uncharacterized protein YacL